MNEDNDVKTRDADINNNINNEADDVSDSKRMKVSHDADEDEFDEEDEDEERGHRRHQRVDNHSPPAASASAVPSSSYSRHDERDRRERDHPRDRDMPRKPNSILFFRGLPQHCHEREIADVCKPFGMTNAVILSLSRQAFVEFETLDKAVSFMETHNGQCIIRYVAYITNNVCL